MRIQRRAESAAEVASERIEPDVLPGQRRFGCPTTGRLATATDRCSWRPSCSPTASPVPVTAPPTGPTSDRPRSRQTRRPLARWKRDCAPAPRAGSRSGRCSPPTAAVLCVGQRSSRCGRGEPPSRRWRQSHNHRQHATLAGDQVAHLCSRQRRIAEVVIAVHVLAPQLRFALIGERSHLQVGVWLRHAVVQPRALRQNPPTTSCLARPVPDVPRPATPVDRVFTARSGR